ncbi:MAG: hypothetical protein MJE12_15980 [Alphaproteobacteria bacterium]|nr:hypothetical protein [Alphaproteobacteria bacterium]
MTDVNKAAELLIAARRDNRVIDALPDDAAPQTLAESYAIQDAIIAGIGLPLAGWKVALTNDQAKAMVGASEPAAGPLFTPHILPSPDAIADPPAVIAGFECEFAVCLGADIPASGAPYTADSVRGAIDSLHPAIEVVGLRIGNRPELGVNGIVADHAGNNRLVYGDAVADWQSLDLPSCAVRHLVDDEEAAASSGANVLGNPLNALAWLANHLAGRGYEMKAGEWITTGAATGPLPAPPGSTVTADFGDLGKVVVKFGT